MQVFVTVMSFLYLASTQAAEANLRGHKQADGVRRELVGIPSIPSAPIPSVPSVPSTGVSYGTVLNWYMKNSWLGGSGQHRGRSTTPACPASTPPGSHANREDISHFVKDIESQLHPVSQARPKDSYFSGIGDYRMSSLVEHIQGMARLRGAFAFVANRGRSARIGYAKDNGYLRQPQDHVTSVPGKANTAQAAGNVMAYLQYDKDGSSPHVFFHHMKSGGSACQLYQLKLELKSAYCVGLAFNPDDAKYYLASVGGGGKVSLYRSKDSHLIGASCTTGGCWEIIDTNIKTDETPWGSFDGGCNLIWDSQNHNMYLMVMKKANLLDTYKLDIPAETSHTKPTMSLVRQNVMKHIFEQEGIPCNLAIAVGNEFTDNEDSPKPSFRWAATAYANEDGRLMVAASQRDPCVYKKGSGWVTWYESSWQISTYGPV